MHAHFNLIKHSLYQAAEINNYTTLMQAPRAKSTALSFKCFKSERDQWN